MTAHLNLNGTSHTHSLGAAHTKPYTLELNEIVK